MANLIYSAIASLDGYIEDAEGGFGWGEPDEEVFRFLNELVRPIRTYLYGRKMYDVLSYWESAPTGESAPDYIREWAEIWRGVDKVVFSRTLDAVSTARTRIERRFDAEAVWALKKAASHDLAIAGPDLAGQAIESGLVEELQIFTVPLIVGGGKPWLPTGVHLRLSLRESHSFANGFTFHRYGLM